LSFFEEGMKRDSALIDAEWHSDVLTDILEQEPSYRAALP